MYVPFFGLQHAPFSIAPDPRYLFMSERHREALAHLLYGLDAGGGFVLLTGDIGTGKTTVCRCFLEQIPAHCNVAYIFNPKLTVNELLRSICDEFGVAHAPSTPGGETVKDCIDPLNAFLLAQHAAGRNNVLVIDEAQNLSPDVLEQLRLLTNLETSERKLLQIILIGQPELRGMVADPALEQLAQRVIARFHLDALSLPETQQYIAHRMAVAGLAGPVPFDRRALQRVHALSRGVPRRINLLCDRALLGAYASGTRTVTEPIVQQAAQEVFGPAAPRPTGGAARWALAGGAAVAGAAAMAGVVWALGGWAGETGGSKSPGQTSVVAAARMPATSASAASAAGGAAAAPLPDAAALQAFLQQQPWDEAGALRTLAAAWGTPPVAAGADPCAAMLGEGLRCYRNRRAGLALVRQLDRPVVLTLFPAGTGSAGGVGVLLRRLEGDTATLEGGGGRTVQVPVAALGPLWQGDIATYWRAPPGVPDGSERADTPAALAWLDQQLAAAVAGTGPAGAASAPAPMAAGAEARRARIHRFQVAQGLVPDGQAGPLTLMLLNRAAGVSEPRLRAGT